VPYATIVERLVRSLVARYSKLRRCYLLGKWWSTLCTTKQNRMRNLTVLLKKQTRPINFIFSQHQQQQPVKTRECRLRSHSHYVAFTTRLNITPLAARNDWVLESLRKRRRVSTKKEYCVTWPITATPMHSRISFFGVS
jgi:hypothetical protein